MVISIINVILTANLIIVITITITVTLIAMFIITNSNLMLGSCALGEGWVPTAGASKDPPPPQ